MLFILDRKEFTFNNKYRLYPIAEENREDYVELHRQVNGENTLFKYPMVMDLMWEETINGKTKVYSIYNMEGKFCGSIELQKPTSYTSEIGIDLLESFRNKGVAPSVVPLFAKAVCKQQNVQYFKIRITASNSHSKHVFEKLGAKFIEEEESSYKKIMKKIIGLKEGAEEASKLADKYEADDEPVYVYKLSANMEHND